MKMFLAACAVALMCVGCSDVGRSAGHAVATEAVDMGVTVSTTTAREVKLGGDQAPTLDLHSVADAGGTVTGRNEKGEITVVLEPVAAVTPVEDAQVITLETVEVRASSQK